MKSADIGHEPISDPKWNWRNQLEIWEGNCLAFNILQSPINIDGRNTIPVNQKDNYKFVIDFGVGPFYVVKRFTEVQVQFLQSVGTLSIIYNDITIQFQPVGLYFRFPAEHTFNQVRFSGELIIRCNQLQEDQVKQINLT